MTIKDGDLIYLIYDKRRKWVRKVEADKEFHTDRGMIKFNDIIGKDFGITITSHPYNHKFYVFKPLPSDIIVKMGRASQIIYPEDIGLILMYTGISPGSKVIEAGCGSGSLTSIMGIYVQPEGHIFSFDIREKAIKQALKNVARLGCTDAVTIELKDIMEDELDFNEDIDTVILDMGSPWLAIPKIRKYLKNSGTICCFSPVMEQVKKNHFALEDNGFHQIATYELLKRKIQVKRKAGFEATSPESRMVGHTGYLTFARKLNDVVKKQRAEEKKKNIGKKEFVKLIEF